MRHALTDKTRHCGQSNKVNVYNTPQVRPIQFQEWPADKYTGIIDENVYIARFRAKMFHKIEVILSEDLASGLFPKLRHDGLQISLIAISRDNCRPSGRKALAR